MNTEQLKTAEQTLRDLYKRISSDYPDESFCDFDENDRENKYLIETLETFASQESKRAVDEFKEKLRKLIDVEQWSRHDVSDKRQLDERLNELIDKL